MRIVAVFLLVLFPGLLCAQPPVDKDKYLKCNCHITPGITSKNPAKTHVKSTHKKKKKQPGAQKTVTPPVPKPAAPEATPAADSDTSPVDADTVQPVPLPVTPVDNKYPGTSSIITSNKLALPAGKAVYAPGELVFLSGRVLDENCVPVSDAIIDIWQADPEGKFVKSTLADRLSPYPAFTGTGRAITDNLGRFNFVTVFPGTPDGHAPHINVRVAHKHFATLSTKMFFENDRRNAGEAYLDNLNTDERNLLMAKTTLKDPSDESKGLNAEWDISLKGKNPYRHF